MADRPRRGGPPRRAVRLGSAGCADLTAADPAEVRTAAFCCKSRAANIEKAAALADEGARWTLCGAKRARAPSGGERFKAALPPDTMSGACNRFACIFSVILHENHLKYVSILRRFCTIFVRCCLNRCRSCRSASRGVLL